MWESALIVILKEKHYLFNYHPGSICKTQTIANLFTQPLYNNRQKTKINDSPRRNFQFPQRRTNTRHKITPFDEIHLCGV